MESEIQMFFALTDGRTVRVIGLSDSGEAQCISTGPTGEQLETIPDELIDHSIWVSSDPELVQIALEMRDQEILSKDTVIRLVDSSKKDVEA
jgi:hypothetical protein